MKKVIISMIGLSSLFSCKKKEEIKPNEIYKNDKYLMELYVNGNIKINNQIIDQSNPKHLKYESKHFMYSYFYNDKTKMLLQFPYDTTYNKDGVMAYSIHTELLIKQ